MIDKIVFPFSMITILIYNFLLYGQSKKQSDWENLNVLQKNREPAHAFYVPYQNEKTALTIDAEQSDYYKLLNGQWKFHWVRKPVDRLGDGPAQNEDHEGNQGHGGQGYDEDDVHLFVPRPERQPTLVDIGHPSDHRRFRVRA